MGKSSSRTSSNKSTNKGFVRKGDGRPKPMTPKAGVTLTRRRYEYGG